MNAKKLITILGLAIIFVGLGIAGYFVFQKGLISLGSDPEIIPAKVQITNIGSDKFSVSWLTGGKTNGSVIYGQNSKLEQIELDDVDQLTGQSKARKVHHVTVEGLKPAATYYFKIRSGENNKKFDKDGEPYMVKTAPVLGSQPPSDMISGTIMAANDKPAEGSVVYVDIAGMNKLSTHVTKNGDWLINLSNARNKQLTDYASYDLENALINITVQGEDKTSKVVTNTSNKSPVPEVILGQAYDFTSVQEDVGNVGIGGDEEKEEEIERPLESFVQTQITEVTVDYPVDGDEIDTTTPIFSGEGPANTVITLMIEEDEEFSGSKTIDVSEEWEFSFSNPLEAGQEYTLKVDYVDEEGEEANVTTEFSISEDAEASDDNEEEDDDSSPNYSESTPSGDLNDDDETEDDEDEEEEASESASTKGGVRKSMPSTDSGTPESGMALPTVILLILGGGLIASGYKFKKIN